MIIVAEHVLDADDLEYLRRQFRELDEQPGAVTAHGDLEQVKNNRQLVLGGRAAEVRSRVLGALNRSDPLTLALLPKTTSVPLLNVYGPGEGYGPHTDAHLGAMGGRYFRCDISATLFLDEPGDYDGGELVIEEGGRPRAFKLAAGSAVFYPTTCVHAVNTVTRGERRACVLWFESLVRDVEKRRLLFELQQVRTWIEEHEPPSSEPRRKLVNACENLLRMWVET